MSKGAATEARAARLHELVFNVLIEQVSERVTEVIEVEEGDDKEVELFTATPALLTVALKALKDNEITCVAEEGSKVNELQEALSKRKKGHGSVIRLVPESDEACIG